MLRPRILSPKTGIPQPRTGQSSCLPGTPALQDGAFVSGPCIQGSVNIPPTLLALVPPELNLFGAS